MQQGYYLFLVVPGITETCVLVLVHFNTFDILVTFLIGKVNAQLIFIKTKCLKVEYIILICRKKNVLSGK